MLGWLAADRPHLERGPVSLAELHALEDFMDRIFSHRALLTVYDVP